MLITGEQAKFVKLYEQLCCGRVVLIHAFVQPAAISEILLFAKYSSRYSESYRNVNG